MPLSDDAQAFLDEIARRTHGFLGADLMELCRDAGLTGCAAALATCRSSRSVPHSAAGPAVDAEDFEIALSQIRPRRCARR